MPNRHVILLLEDNDDDAFFFQRVVDKVGLDLQTHRAHNGQEGIDYLLGAGSFSDRARFPLPTIVLVDLKMPVCDGYDFLAWKAGQDNFACLPAIVMTSSRQESDIRRCYQLGAHSFTAKVSTMELLRERIAVLREWWLKHCVLINQSA